MITMTLDAREKPSEKGSLVLPWTFFAVVGALFVWAVGRPWSDWSNLWTSREDAGEYPAIAGAIEAAARAACEASEASP